ncbi:MAG: hypothetical protein PVH68_02890 [Armatimonadota bacterium]|jgi:hypothetical protein
MRRIMAVGSLLAALGGLVALASALQARPATQTQFRYVYRVRPRTHLYRSSCLVCHKKRRGGGKLNKYGQDLRRAGHYGKYEFKGYRAIEKRDSDKDGFANGEELKAHKLPGSRSSRPKRQKKASVSTEKKPKETDENAGESEGQDEEKKDETPSP